MLEIGYAKRSDQPRKLSENPEFQARVAEIAAEDARSGPGLPPVIAALMDGAAAAMRKDSAAGYSAAARMLAEAGRLKQKLPKTQSSDLKDWAKRWVKD